jgi:hypothetical protein
MPSTPLASLSPRWLSTAPGGHPRCGIAFTCPRCAPDALEVQALFQGVPGPELRHHHTGDSFAVLSLTPEVTCPAGHRVWVTLGDVVHHSSEV